MKNTSAMKSADEQRLARLIRQQRWVALASLDQHNAPYASWVAWAPEADFSGFILHLSRLALHTRNALKHSQVSITLTEADDGQSDPQQLARLTLQGQLTPLDGEVVQAKALYLERFPDAAMLFDFADFSLFRFKPESGRYVEGFASSHRIKPEQLALISTL